MSYSKSPFVNSTDSRHPAHSSSSTSGRHTGAGGNSLPQKSRCASRNATPYVYSPSWLPISPTTRTSVSRFDSHTRKIISCSAINLCRDTIPAPCRLSTTVCVSSENTRPSSVAPIIMMGTDRVRRPLRRCFEVPVVSPRPFLLSAIFLAFWGRGQVSFYSNPTLPPARHSVILQLRDLTRIASP